MLSSLGDSASGEVLAHPLTQPFDLPVSPVAVALMAAAAILVVAFGLPQRAAREPGRTAPPATSWAGSLSTPMLVSRSLSVVFLLLAIGAGRLGTTDQLENLAPALVVGVAWPLLVLASLLLGPVWRWTDPWDSMARALGAAGGDRVGEHVWPAVAFALAWVWYLSALPDPLGPRAVGAALALYTLATVAGCLFSGRAAWLGTSEPMGIALSWMALLPRGRLGDWRPVRGADALLGVLAGGVLFGGLRRSELWGDLNAVPSAALLATLGVAGSSALCAGLLMGLARGRRSGGVEPMVAQAAVPAVAGIILAVAMDRNRLLTSLQLLPGLLGDPFGLGWDLLGRAGAGVNPAPLGTSGLTVAQLGVLFAGHLAGIVAVTRCAPRRERALPAAASCLLIVASVIAISTH